MTFPLDRYIADGVRRVKADPQGDLVWFTDAQFSERQAREQAIRDCIARVYAYADERLVITQHPNRSEDITAALRVAAHRLRALLEDT